MDNLNQQASLVFDMIHDSSKIDESSITVIIDFVIDLCHQSYFDVLETVDILHNLNKLKDYREYHGYKDHPSIPKILSDIGNIMLETSSSQLALPFFMEQLRIEKYYLGGSHPDLASVLFNIGQVYERNDQMAMAQKHFGEALSLLSKHNRKGRLYPSVLYHIGLTNYRQSLYKNANEYFNLAIVEYQNAYNDFDPTVAEIHMKVGQLQLEIGKLQDAMDNFLKALMIIRMVFGNNYSQITECLYGIGLIHEARDEHKEAINVLYQALTIAENGEVDNDDITLLILHRIGLLYQSIEETENATAVFDDLKNIIKSKACDDEAEDKLLSSFGLNCCSESYPAAAAA